MAKKDQEVGCPHCPGPLHQANYQRKPRGGPDSLDDEHRLRFSFCCYRCRKRLTPSSLRFLGRKVYFGGILVLVSTMLGGGSLRRRQKLHELCGADGRTLGRWRDWWAEVFSQTRVWVEFSSRVALWGNPTHAIPRRLLRSMGGPKLQDALVGVLRLLLPLTGGGGSG